MSILTNTTSATTPSTLTFSDLGLAEPLMRALSEEGYAIPTPIQGQAIPSLIEGRDVLGIAQTGTGKTAAFALPLLHRLASQPRKLHAKSARILVLTPTRELAVQVEQSFAAYGRYLKIRHATIFGGVGQMPQVRALERGVDVLVATPGRLQDLMNQGHVTLAGVEAFVLDEADRMLAMGFIQPVRKIVAKLPEVRHTLMFSATMPEPIAALAATLLRRPLRVEVTPPSTTVERIAQTVMFVDKAAKRDLLIHILTSRKMKRVLVFTRTKHGANRLSEQLTTAGIPSGAIHGNKSQTARQKALNDFRDGALQVLVATDIAARGIDIDSLGHVVNYELPNEPESYVHRIGRTARAGKDGTALSFCDMEEIAYLRDIEKSIRTGIPVEFDQPWHAIPIAELHASGGRVARPALRQGRPGGGGPGRDGAGKRPGGPKREGGFGKPANGNKRDGGPNRDAGAPKRDGAGKPNNGPKRDSRPAGAGAGAGRPRQGERRANSGR